MGPKKYLHIGALVIVGWLLGLGHGVLSSMCPSLRLDLLILAGMAAALAGIIKGFAALAFDEDRPKSLPLFGALLGAVALMGSWCGWVWEASQFEHFMLLHPIDLFQTVWDVASHGEYTVTSRGGSMSTGVAQPSVKWAWICEAAVLFFTPLLSAVFWVYENRDQWTNGEW